MLALHASTPAPDDQPPQPVLTLHPTLASKVNFASAQNGVAVIRELRIENAGSAAAEGLRLTLTAHPALLREKTWIIDRLPAGGSLRLTDLETPLDPALLGGLDEAEIGQLQFRLAAQGVADVVQQHPVEMLARDEWGGLAEMDNILAAFVSPNQPCVARILKEASRLLEAAGQSGALDGYQSGSPQRVWMLAGAIWSAATGLGLSYAVPPPSFERSGQKVRDPERIAAEGLATCLDSTLLLAAAYEAAGLNSAVLFAQGHAWAGVWLLPRDFGRLVEPDVIAVRKAAVAREFVPVETTLLTRRPTIGFEQAVEAGRDRLSEAREAEFVQAVDITRARAARIRPLASHRPAEAAMQDEAGAAPAALPRPLDLGLLPGELADETPATALGRVERWQRKLLDLSLGNRLLNFRDTRGAVPMICPDIARTEDRLANGELFRLLALKDEHAVSGRDLPPDEARRIETDLARDALTRGQIAVPLTAAEMTAQLTELYRKARSDMAEGGTNTLFLAVGFLRWKRSEGDARAYRAPLLLLPARLERRSAQSEFRLSQFEDEVRINFTLLELLKRDFELRIPELEGDLPRDDSGLDLARILEILRQRIRDVAGFEVVEDCALSTFSFSKYLMWKDLVDRTDNLRESRMVAHLVDSPSEVFAGAHSPMPRPADIDRRYAPGDLLAPLAADSSQLSAVLAAAEGHDFVLIGPPGTGKSQTITNIIADQLGRGRTVLFVAEKSAALDVVHRRLERHGLGDAVLELHSNKADRKKVLTQLGRSWDRSAAAHAQDWVRIAEDLRLTRDQLNAYVDALHRPGTQGFSVFQAIGRVAGGAAPFALRFDNRDCHDAESWQRLRRLAEDLGLHHRMVADIDPQGPLSLLDHGEWSFGWQDAYLGHARALRQAGEAAHRALRQIAGRLGLAPAEAAAADGALIRLAQQRLGKAAVAEAALHDPEALRQAAAALAEALARARSARRALAAQYPDDVLAEIPLETLELQWREAQARIWPFAGMAQTKVARLLQTYARSGQADPACDLAALKQLRRARAEILASPLRGLPGFAGEDSDLARLQAELDAAVAYLAFERGLQAAGIPAARLQVLRPLLAQASAGDLAPLLQDLLAAAVAVQTAQAAFRAAGGDLSPAAGALLPGLEAQQHRFADWLKWRSSRAQAIASGLGPLVVALEGGADIPDPGRAFEQAYMGWWLRLAMDAEPCLRGFAHWQHDALIARFRQLDAALADLATTEVMRKLGNDLPGREAVPRNSELGGLRHQLGLQRPTKAIRSLIGDLPTTFGKLAPCVLMSPLSVAQYLPAGQAQFDLVIFDEASQISTWDAIGAIARGRQAIIVGDPKQLPPTNFFGRNEEDAEDGGDLAEYERDMPSILDEVAAAGIPTHRLNWHYRSRDEALIAFSNHFYYDGGLVTFPSPDAAGQAVRLHRIAGTYQRGNGRTNPVEARAIVAFIRRRLQAWLKLDEDRRPTLGVITFNAQQQGLILDLLDAERKAQPEFEWFFADEREEPVIVKNLENIQGDERDIMLFSIAFGPDQAGRLVMGFGALNGEGGEKRLNVAVTRAREELHVFASVSADQIDLTRTRARGVADLKAFLDFADRGAIALAARDSGSLGPVDSPFEAAVRDALALRGWEAHSQIGVSGFRIDLGVRHPDHAGVWLAGVECDGASYHSSATARDRDRIRQAVLEGLGWTILRIWSTDWFRSPQTVLERIDAQLRAVLEGDRARRAAAAAAEPAAEEEPEPEPEPHGAEASDAATTATTGQHDPGRFFDEDYTADLLALLRRLVSDHGPLTDGNLARRVAQLHGWQRTGARIQARIAALHPAFDLTREEDVQFIWPKDGVTARVPFRGLGDRALREVSRCEIATLIDRHATDLARAEDPELELARHCGITRLSKDARDYLAQCRAWHRAGADAVPPTGA